MSKNKRIKSPNTNDKVQIPKGKTLGCGVPRTAVFFSLQYITDKKNYNIKDLEKGRTNLCKKVFDSLEKYSQFSWEELKRKGKSSGGYEMLQKGNLNEDITDKWQKARQKQVITNDEKLYVFRAGKEIRIIGYKSKSCAAAIHILGFDFDFSLYDHG